MRSESCLINEFTLTAHADCVHCTKCNTRYPTRTYVLPCNESSILTERTRRRGSQYPLSHKADTPSRAGAEGAARLAACRVSPKGFVFEVCISCRPQFNCLSPRSLPVLFPSLPEGGTKSRVETQIRLTVDLAHASSSSGEPLKYDKVGSWKWLRLPKGTSTKKRTRKEGKVGKLGSSWLCFFSSWQSLDAASEESLYLTTDITCATPPHTPVAACSSCQTREVRHLSPSITPMFSPSV